MSRAWDSPGIRQAQAARPSALPTTFSTIRPRLNYSTHPGQERHGGARHPQQSRGRIDESVRRIPGRESFPFAGPSHKEPGLPVSGAYYNIPLNLPPTYTQEWDLSYQRQLGANWLFSGTYLGNKTTHSWVETEQDPGVYIPGTCNGKACSSTSNLNQRRVLYLENPVAGAYYSTMASSDGGANTEYNGLLFSARRRLNANYTILANYTYSHCISEANFIGELAGPGYQNPYNRDADRGNCAFDLRHIFNLSLVAMMPHIGGNPFLRAVLNDWQIAPLFSAAARLAVHSRDGRRRVDDGRWPGPPRRDRTALRPQHKHAAVAQSRKLHRESRGHVRECGPYSLFAPSYFDLDVAVSRMFKVRESQRLEVRFEAFNATNRANFAAPVATETNAHFGQITSAGSPRILQFAMKYRF